MYRVIFKWAAIDIEIWKTINLTENFQYVAYNL